MKKLWELGKSVGYLIFGIVLFINISTWLIFEPVMIAIAKAFWEYRCKKREQKWRSQQIKGGKE